MTFYQNDYTDNTQLHYKLFTSCVAMHNQMPSNKYSTSVSSRLSIKFQYVLLYIWEIFRLSFR